MKRPSVSQSLAESIVRAGSYGEVPQRPAGHKPPTAFTIALSREVGAGGMTVANELGQRLGWPVYDHELVERIAREMNLRTRLLESMDEKRISWVEECMAAFSSVPSVTEVAFARHLLQAILALGAHGRCIIVGRGAAQVLPAETTLRVRLIATLADRIANMSRQLNVSREQAARYVHSTERERIQFIKDHFQKDPSDPQWYDLVLNATRFTHAECAEQILEALRQLQAREDSTERQERSAQLLGR